jgi:NTE family protein
MSEYKNIVISGGGFNGFQFFGIIKYLEENNLINNLNKYIGVSMGGFINFLLLIGYKYSEVEKFLINFNFSKIFDLKIENILVDDNFKGLSKGDNFNKLIKKFIKNKGLDENITLKELFEKTNKQFIVGVTNITLNKVEYISHETNPDLPVYLLLRMSSCIPIFFDPVLYNENYYIDGVMKDNFPIQLINENEYNNTIGIVLSTKKNSYDIPNMSSIDYLIHLYRVVINEPIDNKILKYINLIKILVIDPSINSYDYNLTKETRETLIEKGYIYCKNCF